MYTHLLEDEIQFDPMDSERPKLNTVLAFLSTDRVKRLIGETPNIGTDLKKKDKNLP